MAKAENQPVPTAEGDQATPETPETEGVTPEITAKFAELETQLSQYKTATQDLDNIKQELAQERGKSAQAQAMYKGLQRQATQKLQEAAQLQRQMADNQVVLQRLDQQGQVLNFLASRVLDEDQAKEFMLQRREAELKAYEQRLTQPQPQPQTNFNLVDESEQKRQFLDNYFPGSGIDPNDPNLDWGEGLTDQREAFRRLSTSVTQIKDGRTRQPEQVPAPQTTQGDAPKTIEQLQAEFEAQKEAFLQEARAQAAKEAETRLRKAGVDVGSSGARSAAPNPKMQTRLNELDERALTVGEPGSPARVKAQKDYDAKMRKIRDELVKQYQQ